MSAAKFVSMKVSVQGKGWTCRNAEVTGKVLSENAAQGDAGGWTDKLLAKADASKLSGPGRRFKQFVKDNTLRAPEGDGWFWVPIDKVQAVREQFTLSQAELRQAMQEAEQDWPNILQRAKEQLNGLFDADKYPKSGAELMAIYDISVTWRPAPDAAKFLALFGADRAALASAIAAEVQAEYVEAEKTARVDLLNKLAVPLKAFIAKMEELNASDGKGKKLFDSTVQNMARFADIVDGLNVDQDADVTALAAKCRKLGSLTPEVLKGSGGATVLRTECANVAKAAQDDIGRLMAAFKA